MCKQKTVGRNLSRRDQEQEFSRVFDQIRQIFMDRLGELAEPSEGCVPTKQGPEEAVATLERLARKEEVLDLGNRLAVFAYQEHGQALVLMSDGMLRSDENPP